jgi:hypothetical protein
MGPNANNKSSSSFQILSPSILFEIFRAQEAHFLIKSNLNEISIRIGLNFQSGATVNGALSLSSFSLTFIVHRDTIATQCPCRHANDLTTLSTPSPLASLVRKSSRNPISGAMSRGTTELKRKTETREFLMRSATDPDFFLLIAPKGAGGIATRQVRYAIHDCMPHELQTRSAKELTPLPHDSDKPRCMA